MAQFRNPAYPEEANTKTASDVASVRKTLRTGLDWASVVQLENDDQKTAHHGPTSNDAFQAWALPEHLRE